MALGGDSGNSPGALQNDENPLPAYPHGAGTRIMDRYRQSMAWGIRKTVVGRAIRGLHIDPTYSRNGSLSGMDREVSRTLQAHSIQKSRSESQRLEVDAIHLYQIHWPRGRAVRRPLHRDRFDEALQ